MGTRSSFDWYEETGFCNWGCGMHGVNHAENDALCRRRCEERYDQPNCALIYIPVREAEQWIAKGTPREWFLKRTPDGYLPLRTRTLLSEHGGCAVQLGVTDVDTTKDS